MGDDSEKVTIDVVGVHRAAAGGKLLALVDVRVEIAGVDLLICGFRVSRETVNGKPGTSVTSPLHRGADGTWARTVKFPQELLDPLADIVLAACVEDGVCREATPVSR